jgi:hypothetical protein
MREGMTAPFADHSGAPEHNRCVNASAQMTVFLTENMNGRGQT